MGITIVGKECRQAESKVLECIVSTRLGITIVGKACRQEPVVKVAATYSRLGVDLFWPTPTEKLNLT